MDSKSYVCPVCGCKELLGPPYDDHNDPLYEICPCCGVDFGVQDFEFSHSELRDCWIKLGMKWRFLPAPVNWDPLKQLKAAGLWSPLLHRK